jgi:hypothetical protein
MNRKLSEKTLDRLAVPADKQQLIVWDDELPGFGAVVGKKIVTFIANCRANGAKRRQVIDRRGAIRADGNPWTVTLARLRAREILGKVAGGGDPSFELRNRDTGPKLGDAFDLHIARMTADEASASSLATIERAREGATRDLGRPPASHDRNSGHNWRSNGRTQAKRMCPPAVAVPHASWIGHGRPITVSK